jgi:hypothetical protein
VTVLRVVLRNEGIDARGKNEKNEMGINEKKV